MQKNNNDVSKKLLINAFLTIPSSWSSEVIGEIGFDFITIDTQHGLIDYQMMLLMLQSLRSSKSKVLVRVQWNDSGTIMKALDAGASGIICPMINSKEEAEAFVGACLYSPDGYRSFGPIRTKLTGTFSSVKNANKETFSFAMIETEDGIRNLEKIAATKGLSGLYVGPSDLSISLGFEKLADFGNQKFRNILKKIVKAAEKNNIIPATHLLDSTQIKLAADLGFKMMTPVNDSTMLEKSTTKELKEIRSIISNL